VLPARNNDLVVELFETFDRYIEDLFIVLDEQYRFTGGGCSERQIDIVPNGSRHGRLHRSPIRPAPSCCSTLSTSMSQLFGAALDSH